MGVTVNGVDDLLRATDRAGERLEAGLRSVAQRTAARIRNGAQSRVRLHTGATRRGIVIVESHDKGQIRVEATPAPLAHPMLPWWIELGTSKMPAAPFMGPAIDAERSNYAHDGEGANNRALEELR
jgi:HK97 gp10 family phage protein